MDDPSSACVEGFLLREEGETQSERNWGFQGETTSN